MPPDRRGRRVPAGGGSAREALRSQGDRGGEPGRRPPSGPPIPARTLIPTKRRINGDYAKVSSTGAGTGRMVLFWPVSSFSRGSVLACAAIPPAPPSDVFQNRGTPPVPPAGAAPPAPRSGNGGGVVFSPSASERFLTLPRVRVQGQGDGGCATTSVTGATPSPRPLQPRFPTRRHPRRTRTRPLASQGPRCSFTQGCHYSGAF